MATSPIRTATAPANSLNAGFEGSSSAWPHSTDPDRLLTINDVAFSGLKLAASGHYYFTLKDAQAQVRCVAFRSSHRYWKLAESGVVWKTRRRVSPVTELGSSSGNRRTWVISSLSFFF
jgi:hypothetical protein